MINRIALIITHIVDPVSLLWILLRGNGIVEKSFHNENPHVVFTQGVTDYNVSVIGNAVYLTMYILCNAKDTILIIVL